VGKGYFEGLIRTWLLENKHASIVIIRPEKGLTARQEEALKKTLQGYKETLSKEEIAGIVAFTKHLEEYQSEPSKQEELEKIPLLEREDIRKEALPFQNKEHQIDGVTLVHHDYFTNGIGYVNLIFRAGEIPKDLIPYLGLLKSILGKVDTEHYSYGEFSTELNLHTGGISCGVNAYDSIKENKAYTPVFEVRSKALYEEMEVAFTMLGEMLLTSRMTSQKRLAELVSEGKSRLQMTFQTAGHSMAALRCMSYYSEHSCFMDLTGGVEFYRFLEETEASSDEKWELVAANLQRLTRCLFRPENLIGSYTAEEKSLCRLETELRKLIARLHTDKQIKESWKLVPVQKNEGLKTSSQIQYVARSGSFAKAGLLYTGALKVLRTIMSYDYLWNNVRVKGGAYGCMNNYTRNGQGYMVSYRDPNLEKTNQVFEESVAYTRDFEVSERDMTKYIIGTISGMDTPLNPNAKGARSMGAWLSGLTLAQVQKEREEVLTCGCKDIRALAPYLQAILAPNHLCVIGNEELLSRNSHMFESLENLFH